MRKFTLILVLMLLVIGYSCKKTKKQQQENGALPTPTYEDSVVSDQPYYTDTDSVVVVDTTTVIRTEDSTGQLHPVSNNIELKPSQKIYVIVGSYKNYNNAKRKLEKLHKQGYSQATILPKYGQLHRVAIEGYSDEKNARVALQRYRKQLHDKSIWLLLR